MRRPLPTASLRLARQHRRSSTLDATCLWPNEPVRRGWAVSATTLAPRRIGVIAEMTWRSWSSTPLKPEHSSSFSVPAIRLPTNTSTRTAMPRLRWACSAVTRSWSGSGRRSNPVPQGNRRRSANSCPIGSCRSSGNSVSLQCSPPGGAPADSVPLSPSRYRWWSARRKPPRAGPGCTAVAEPVVTPQASCAPPSFPGCDCVSGCLVMPARRP